MKMPNEQERLDHRAEVESQLLEAIKEWFKTKQYGPAFRDLADATGRSLGTVHALCRSLRTKHLITFTDNISRSIRLV